MNSICIVDFCGHIEPGHFPYSVWADYWSDKQEVSFGGEWCNVPNMPAANTPTETEVIAWVSTWKHGGKS